MSDDAKPAPGRCRLCEAEGGEVYPCLGCETPYHEACFVKRGCTQRGCALEGLPGRHREPHDPYLTRVARVLWVVFVGCLIGNELRPAGPHMLDGSTVDLLVRIVFGAALVVTITAFLADLLRPVGRLLAWEVAGSVLILTAFLLADLGLGQREDGLMGAGWAAFPLGVIAMSRRPGRKTHHPLRLSGGVPEMVGTLLAAYLALAVLVSTFTARRLYRRGERGNTYACYANQKTLAGALEMYNLDRHAHARLDPAAFRVLQSGGYLQSIPQDPGQGPGTSGNYRSTRASHNGVTCTVHGAIQ